MTLARLRIGRLRLRLASALRDRYQKWRSLALLRADSVARPQLKLR